MMQGGAYSTDGSQLTVTLDIWNKPSAYIFSVDGNRLIQNENRGYGISGTFAKQ